MITVDLKDLGPNSKSAVEYIKTRLGTPVRVKGTIVQLELEHAREAKLVLHKYLRQAGLAEYRVVVTHPGHVRVEAAKKIDHPRTRRGEGATPSTWETVPGESWLAPAGLTRPNRKNSKR